MKAVKNYYITDHAQIQMKRRGISEKHVAEVLLMPEQIEIVGNERAVYQSLIHTEGNHKIYLLRVFVDINRDPPAVVTVYRTSKIDKYRRNK